MTRLIAIEINDAGLVVAAPDGVLAVEPGYAVLEDREIVTGAPAYAQSRVKPRQASNRHWAELSAEPGSAAIAGVRSSAELAYAQLAKIWSEFADRADAVLLVVPSSYKSEQLGLLLGLARECGMPVRAMVDAAAAASVRPYPARQLVYVDAGLHGVTATPVEQGDEATALQPMSLESAGLASLMDAFARRIAELFVLATRFDPFHEASTEQLLYDGLSEWLGQLREEPTTALSIPYAGEAFEVELERAQLLGAAQGFYKALLQLVAQTRSGRTGLAVQLSDRLARLPGIMDALSRLDDCVIVGLDAGHAAAAALEAAHAFDLGAEQVKLLRHMPWREAPAEEVAPVAAAAPVAAPLPDAPTHLVYRGIAYPVNGEGVVIGRSKVDERRAILLEDDSRGVSRSHCEVSLVDGELKLRDLSRHGTFVNERRVDGEEVLRPADVIRIGSPGVELVAVIVEGGDGT